jgi:hypothetical protein
VGEDHWQGRALKALGHGRISVSGDVLAGSSADRLGLRAGFSLVEVALAVLVVGIGLLGVFSLFPAGLRSSESDTEDTRRGLFIDTVFNGMRANAANIQDRVKWNDGEFENVATKGLPVIPTAVPESIRFPDPGTSDYLRYRLDLVDHEEKGIGFTNVTYRAVLEMADGQYGLFTNIPAAYTEFSYTGK